MSHKDITRQKFGKLRALRPLGCGKDRKQRWQCRCSCGTVVIVRLDHLTQGRVKSCGCLRRKVAAQTQKRRHRLARMGVVYAPAPPRVIKSSPYARGYYAWRDAIRRCTDPNDPGYGNYGGRGIKMCSRWLESFKNFLEDMGAAPPGLTIDRIDNDGDYEPGNCRWTTWEVQQNNKRTNCYVWLDGERMTLTQAARRYEMKPTIVHGRVRDGWELMRALTTPLRRTRPYSLQDADQPKKFQIVAGYFYRAARSEKVGGRRENSISLPTSCAPTCAVEL